MCEPPDVVLRWAAFLGEIMVVVFYSIELDQIVELYSVDDKHLYYEDEDEEDGFRCETRILISELSSDKLVYLDNFSKEDIKIRMPFGKYKGVTLESIPTAYLLWLRDRAYGPLHFAVIEELDSRAEGEWEYYGDEDKDNDDDLNFFGDMEWWK